METLPPFIHPTEKGTRFVLYAPSAHTVSLSIEDRIIPLQKEENFWTIEVEGVKPETSYTYSIDGKEGILDPYATTYTAGLKGVIPSNKSFDWQAVSSPNRPLSDLIIYEAHLPAFTASSKVAYPGTFLGMIGKISYLQKLGINTIELLPVFEFDPDHYKGYNPKTGERLKNFWGYGSLGFFAPMSRYAYSDPIEEFKTLVREMHRAGIEVILDVVYNHTGEGPLLFYEEAEIYYLMEGGHHTNYSGCGNTLACNREKTKELILDSLRYWTEEIHIDGFRFDLASILTRGERGVPLENPPLLEAIRSDPLLSQKKMIVEPWDCGGLYQLGQFPKWGPFAEWNGEFRDTVRRFIKGTDGQAKAFANALIGSPDLYQNPTSSVNFVTAHDGFSLNDLVTYNEKHNEANGEDNRDGNDHNESWNCGVEGPSNDPDILGLRARQKRNFLLALLIARGVPMIQMGDEVGHSKEGNNNTWCQDNELSYFPWGKEDQDLLTFVKGLIAFRKAHPELKEGKVIWHQPDWGGHFIALEIEGIYIAFNASSEKREITLPATSTWLRIVDTALFSPHDFSEEEEAFPLDPNHPYLLEAYSALLTKASHKVHVHERPSAFLRERYTREHVPHKGFS